jgi:hypothetical protein
MDNNNTETFVNISFDGKSKYRLKVDEVEPHCTTRLASKSRKIVSPF